MNALGLILGQKKTQTKKKQKKKKKKKKTNKLTQIINKVSEFTSCLNSVGHVLVYQSSQYQWCRWEKWTKTQFFAGKFADLQMRLKSLRFSRFLSKLSCIRRPGKGRKSFTIYFIYLFKCIDVSSVLLSYSYPISEVFCCTIIFECYATFTWGVHYECTDGKLKKKKNK